MTDPKPTCSRLARFELYDVLPIIAAIRHCDNEEHPIVREVRERKLGKPDNM